MPDTLRLPTGLSLPDCPDLHLGAELHWPECEPRGLLVGLAGGGMQRRYFDLPVPDDASFSFARQMTAQGYAVVLVDHPGIGGSDRPADSYALTPAWVAAAHAGALQGLLRQQGRLAELPRIGVGHSMGAMVALIAQAEHACFDALALLGFGFEGLPQYLPPAAKALLDDHAALLDAAPDLARKMFRVDYPQINGDGSGIYAGRQAEAAAAAAVKDVRAPLLPVPAFLSMVPHLWDAHAARIAVPVLVALGDKDLVRPPDNVQQILSASPQAQVLVLPDTGHSQFLFPSRQQLFARLCDWMTPLTGQRNAGELT